MKISSLDLSNIKSLSLEYKKRVVAHADLLRAHIKAIENEVSSDMRRGSVEYSDILKLVRTRPNRKLTSDALDKDMSPLLEHLAPEDLTKEVPITLTELEKLLKMKLELKRKDVQEILSPVVTRPEGSIVAVPLSDKRAAVDAPDLSKDFEGM